MSCTNDYTLAIQPLQQTRSNLVYSSHPLRQTPHPFFTTVDPYNSGRTFLTLLSRDSSFGHLIPIPRILDALRFRFSDKEMDLHRRSPKRASSSSKSQQRIGLGICDQCSDGTVLDCGSAICITVLTRWSGDITLAADLNHQLQQASTSESKSWFPTPLCPIVV